MHAFDPSIGNLIPNLIVLCLSKAIFIYESILVRKYGLVLTKCLESFNSKMNKNYNSKGISEGQNNLLRCSRSIVFLQCNM